MTSFDIFIVIVVLVAGLLGWRAGFMKQVGKLIGVILGIVACRLFGQILADMFCGDNPDSTDRILYTVLAYVVLFISIYACAAIVVYMMRGFLGMVRLGCVDRLAGALLRIVIWLLMLSLVLNLWESISPVTSLAEDPVYVRMLWFGPYLLGTDAAAQVGNVVTSAIGM